MLARYYYDPKTGFQSADKLYRRVQQDGKTVTRRQVTDFLSNQSSVQRTTQYRAPKRDQYQPIMSGVDGAYQIDLTFMPHDKQINRNHDTLLTAIEITSRKLYAIALRGKETATILRAMLALFSAVTKSVQTVTCDLGSEFTSNACKKLFEDKGIRVYYADKADHHKMGMIERVHRTLKGILTKYMTAHNTKCWVDQLGAAVSNYNSSHHTTIKMTPNEADGSEKGRQGIRQEATERSQRTTHDQLHEGDMVRSLIDKELFDKEKPRWSKQVYRITECNGTSYRISDGATRRWKRYELMKVTKEAESNPLPRPTGPHDVERHLDRARQQRGSRPAATVEPNEPALRERPAPPPAKPTQPRKEQVVKDRSSLQPGTFVYVKNGRHHLSKLGFQRANATPDNPMFFVARIATIVTMDTKKNQMKCSLVFYREDSRNKYVQKSGDPWVVSATACEPMRLQPTPTAAGSIELDPLLYSLLHDLSATGINLVGKTVHKQFGNTEYAGKVDRQRKNTNKTTLFHIRYDDDDEEELTLREIYPLLDDRRTI